MARDVVALIEQDHRDMEQMFERLRSRQGDRALLFQQLAAMLTAHSRAEEAEVYPAIASSGESDEVSHAREEHAEADDLLAGLKTMDPESTEFDETLEKLIEGVSHHIEEEESTALPALRKAVSSQRLDQLAEAFTARRGAELQSGPSPRQVGGSELTREKLYEKAAEHGISGRSQMTKDELRDAVKAAEGK
jgi:hemerythrin-like domain-containing protein